MKVGVFECKHCGTEYNHQYSGSYDATDTPKEYRDDKYCPRCKEAIVSVLKTIPVKFEYQPVKINEVDLLTLLRWKKEMFQEQEAQKDMTKLPIVRKIFAKLYNEERNELQIIREVVGREDKKGRIYVYSYYPSKKEEYTIRVKKRIDLITGEEVGYKINK